MARMPFARGSSRGCAETDWAPGAAATRAVRQRRLAPTITQASRSITAMNRLAFNDSKLSLDALSAIGDSMNMVTQPYQLYIERTDAAKNMARFYAMQISLSLFGETCLIRRWGRIGTSGQMMVHHFGREEEAVRLFLDLTRQKRARGYRPRTFAQRPLR
nr:WGR domain-containing protein [Rhizobium rhizogenes]